MNVDSLSSQLAVIPVVVNAGAALLPAILAAVSTFLALLFKPRELFRVCREKPHYPLIAIGTIGLLVVLASLWPSPAPEGSGRRRASSAAGSAQPGMAGGQVVYVDWTRVALARIKTKTTGPALSVETAEVAPALPLAEESSQPFIFRHGPRRLGAIGGAPSPGLTLAWTHYPRWIDEDGVSQEDAEAMILSSAAVHGSRVYAASCLLDPPDSFGVLFCLDATTGEQIWSLDKIGDTELTGFFSSAAISADGRHLLIGQGLHPDSNCNLICVETESGRVAWTREVPLHLESSPAIDGDTVYIGAGAIEDPATHKPISHPGFVLAVRISDGQELWRHDLADPESSPVVIDGILYIGSGFNGNAVYALRTDSDDALASRDESRQLWKVETPYPITGAITALDDVIIAGGGNGDFVYRDPNPAGVVIAMNRSDGTLLWKTPMPDAVLGAVAAADLLICPVANGELVALDPKTGTRVWATPISGRAPVLAAPAVAGSDVFAVSQDGYLARLNLESGSLLEKVYINSEENPGSQGLSISSPFVFNGSVLVGSETGGFRAYVGTGE